MPKIIKKAPQWGLKSAISYSSLKNQYSEVLDAAQSMLFGMGIFSYGVLLRMIAQSAGVSL